MASAKASINLNGDAVSSPNQSDPHSNLPSAQGTTEHYSVQDEPGTAETPSPGLSPASLNSPPYWLRSSSHQRTVSTTSTESFPINGITLRDNDTNEFSDRNNACWAKSVEITDYTIVNGSASSIGFGAFVVYNIRVETLNGSFMSIRKRYSEFDDFRNQLVLSFPSFEKAMPELPPKSVISKFRPKFLEKRRTGLQYFLNCVLLNPEFSGSPVLKDFLFT